MMVGILEPIIALLLIGLMLYRIEKVGGELKYLGVIILLLSIGLTLLTAGSPPPLKEQIIDSILYIAVPVAILLNLNLVEKLLERLKIPSKYAGYICVIIGGYAGLIFGSGLVHAAGILPALTNGIINSQMAELITNFAAYIEFLAIILGAYLGYLYYKTKEGIEFAI